MERSSGNDQAEIIIYDLSGKEVYSDTWKSGRKKNIVVHEMGLPFKLIETVAYNIITQLKAKFSTVEKCMVKIKKINPPIDGDVNYVSVIVEE